MAARAITSARAKTHGPGQMTHAKVGLGNPGLETGWAQRGMASAGLEQDSIGNDLMPARMINVKRNTAKSIAAKIAAAADIRPAVRARSAASKARPAGAASQSVPQSIPRRLRKQVEPLLAVNYAYMDSPIFKQRRIEANLFRFDGGQEPALPLTSWYQPTRDDALDPSAVGAPQLMKAPEEKLMFLRFNYCKRKLTRLARTIAKQGLTRDLAEQFIDWHRRFEHFREYLVRTNLALVLAMAKRTRLGDVDFAEIVSEGNMALLRAVDKFNVDRGFKFSTYACRAILKAFSRTAQKHTRHRTRFPVEFEPEMEKSDWQDRRRDLVEADCVDELKQIVDRNLADLSNVEQTVIRRRFNWEQTQETPLTLEEVGKIIGVTKERVRQIQNKAMGKIRLLMEDGVLRTKPHVEPEATAVTAPVASAPVAPASDQPLASANATATAETVPTAEPAHQTLADEPAI
jgi:RNA polymerase sigma factor (sigma-70 family)